MKKLLFFLVVIISLFFISNLFKKGNPPTSLKTEIFQAEMPLGEDVFIKIASCPTFYYMLSALENKEGIDIVKTKSTSESLKLLGEGFVDIAISGRALNPGESFLFEKIGPGYDFISAEEIYIKEKDMDLFSFYTDFETKGIIEDFEYISEKNLKKIENIEDYLDKGIIITSLDNLQTGEVVHILNENGSRLRLSRLPRIYYSPGLKKDLNVIKEIIIEN